MQDGYVNLTSTGGVATVTFHHPKSNSLPGHVLRGMAEAVHKAGQDKASRAIVLRSDGDKAFCAGASFDELLSIDNMEKGTAFFSGFAGVIDAIAPRPASSSAASTAKPLVAVSVWPQRATRAMRTQAVRHGSANWPSA